MERPPPSDTSIIRPARPEEAALLSDLEVRSKAYWGYDADFMAVFAAETLIAPEHLQQHIFCVVENSGKVGGFYSLEHRDGEAMWLDNLFIDPDAIRAGYGSLLFDHAVETARALGYRFLEFDSDPNAEGFYLKKGAVRISARPRPIARQPDRMLPKMRLDLMKSGET
jgi:GNAT superfamily N-acetyltransferase